MKLRASTTTKWKCLVRKIKQKRDKKGKRDKKWKGVSGKTRLGWGDKRIKWDTSKDFKPYKKIYTKTFAYA